MYSTKSGTPVGLVSQLDAYSDCARKKADLAGGRRNWLPYAAAIGSGLALATSADASIMYSGTQNVSAGIHMVPGGPENFYLISNFGLFTEPTPLGEILGAAGEVRRLASGAVISNGAGSFGGNQYVANWGVGFAGVEFPINGQNHFGWIRLNEEASSGVAIDWAYESVVGASITAGDTGQSSTPEPNTLGLLALGSVGILALRRKARKEIPTAKPAGL
jgi:hypothetical protein